MIRLIPAVGLALALGASVLAQQQPSLPPQPAPPDVAAPPADAVKTASGLAFKVLQPGQGTAKPGPTDLVMVRYTGWTTDGKMFDSSAASKGPVEFPLNRLIKGWTEGLQLMVAGEKRRFWIPKELAYNDTPNRPAGMLVFEVELVEFSPPPTTPPPDVAKPPADAKKTTSGLAYKQLRPGTGSEHPKTSSSVTVHYTGWTTDGKMFDTSKKDRFQPISFGVGDVIEGWAEGVQLMTVGEKMRFWIPERLAYKGERPPRGMLVFDVELVAIR